MIDIDAAFERYFREYLGKNAGKFTEEELENKVAEIYEEFGNSPLKELGGKSPKGYFKDMATEELVDAIADSARSGCVSDFLCEEISARKDAEKYLADKLIVEPDDEISTYYVNLLGDLGSDIAFGKYVEMLASGNLKESLAESVAEALSEKADKVKEEVISAYNGCGENEKQYFVEIMSNMSVDQRITDILVCELRSHRENIPLYSSYLAKYGDESVLSDLYDIIEDDSLSYVDFKELQLTIEALGGEYERTRDFSADPSYSKIKSQNKH